MGRRAEALAAYERALAICQKLANDNPAVTGFQLELANIHSEIGALLGEAKPAEALAPWERARAIYQKLADASPSVTEFQLQLATNLSNIGEFYVRQKRLADAVGPLDQSVAIMQKLAQKSPDNTTFKTYLGCIHSVRGFARARTGQPAEAAADLRRAVEVLHTDAPLNISQRFYRSWALAQLTGFGGDAKSGVTAAEAAAFADQAVAALRDAIQAGWANPDDLKEPEFDLLRKRDDFQKLQKEVEARAAKRASPDKQPQAEKK
jgi:tetratricopeptide (TPR) repeat protein